MRPIDKATLAGRLQRLLRFRLVVPLLRHPHPPEYTARGVAWGLLLALTPTVGVQIPSLVVIWLLLRWLKREWEFNLLAAIAWVWVTNIVTLPPVYYVFVVTGRLMLGHFDAIPGYEVFIGRLHHILDADVGWLESLWLYTVGLFEDLGLPLFIGWIPWAILASWLGYRWSLRLIIRVRRMRAHRRAARGRTAGGGLPDEGVGS